MRTLTYAQVTAALEPWADEPTVIAHAVHSMARKAFCKAAKLPDVEMPKQLHPMDVEDCIRAVRRFGHQAVCRMATFLIDESARAGELSGL